MRPPGRNQKFAMRGAVSEAGNDIKHSWPRFWSVYTQVETVFLSKFRWSPETKRSSARLKPSFLVKITTSPWPILIANSNGEGGGTIFVFGAKIGLKITKNVVFCILFRPIEGEGDSLPRPPLATLLVSTLFFDNLHTKQRFAANYLIWVKIRENKHSNLQS